MSILGSIAGSVAMSLAKNLFSGGSGDGKQQGGVQIINRTKPETQAEAVARLRKSVKELGGYKGEKRIWKAKQRQSMIGKKRPLNSAKNRTAEIYAELLKMGRIASSIPVGVARSRSISKPRIKQV